MLVCYVITLGHERKAYGTLHANKSKKGSIKSLETILDITAYNGVGQFIKRIAIRNILASSCKFS